MTMMCKLLRSTSLGIGMVVLMFICVCGCSVSLKMELEEPRIEINSELFYHLITSPTTTVGLCCIGIKLATIFVLVCFTSN
jgi:hypothetical protein